MRAVARMLTGACVAYVLLLIYASVMPFDLSARPDEVREHLHRATGSWPFGERVRTSRADIVSNFVLYLPLGALLAARWTLHRSANRWLAGITAAAVGAGISMGVEFAQLHSLTRIASAQDWLVNTAGSATGAFVGSCCGRRAFVRLARVVRLRLAGRRAALLAALLLLVLAADGLFPLLPTLDVGQVKQALRAAHIRPDEAFAQHPWHHWLVRRVAVYAVLAGLLNAAGLAKGPRRYVRGVLLAIAFAGMIEICKPFIVSRTANVANLITAVGGAVLGGGIQRLLVGRTTPRQAAGLAAVMLLAYLAYIECRPFRFAWDAEAAAPKVPHGAEWMPFYHYAMGARLEDIRLFARTLILTSGLTVAALLARGAPARWRNLAVWGLAAAGLGLCLESTQFLLPARIPSTTDVCSFGLGGVLGGWIHLRTARWMGAPPGPQLPYNQSTCTC